MKAKSLFVCMLACAALASCSSDEGNEPDAPKYSNDKAYIQVSLINTDGANSRGTSPGFEEGTDVEGVPSESTVKTTEFYFYNADGTFNQHVAKALSWNTEATPNNNIEKIADVTVVLENLKTKGAPKYVVAVLNGEAGAYNGKSLTELQTAMKTEDLRNSEGYFLMSNTTYNNGDAGSNYYAATIDPETHILEKEPNYEDLTTSNAVKIYVERVACKVDVSVANGVLTNGNYTLGEYEVDGVQKDIEIKVLGWGLNALTKDSYVVKNVHEWTYDLGTFVWDDATNFRSYWAKSTVYGITNPLYPTSYGSTTTVGNSTIANQTLKYVSWNSLSNSIGAPDYCLENTQTADLLLAQNFHAAVTHVLIKAQTVDNKDLVRFDGQLFTAEGYYNRVLGKMMNAYKVTTDADGNTVYTAISKDDLILVDKYDGNVTLELTDEAKAATWSSTKGTTTDLDINVRLSLVDPRAEYYKEGMMYYNIPIEHLRGGKYENKYDETANNGVGAYVQKVEEADYGVVRNHWYKLTVNSIKNLGTAVYNPDEEIVPNPDPQSWYVGAQINILSWKVVTQGNDL